MQPLAERLRPKTFAEFVGQEHLVGEKAALRKMVENGNVSSMIFWGPPGVGKTTLAQIIANQLHRKYFYLSAIHSSVKDIREVIEHIHKNPLFNQQPPLVFLDEIHRFSKSQQDSLLHAVESGMFILIGATTENPSFEVIGPLLSRCQVYVLYPLTSEHLKTLASRAITTDIYLSQLSIEIKEYEALVKFSDGDARKLYNIIELICHTTNNKNIVITNQLVETTLQTKLIQYDKKGDQHYDTISAFIKSIRGSDPNAAVYYLARMLKAGEDVKFIARRLVILAAEDIGLANPYALMLAQSAFDAVHQIGMPEARIILSEVSIFLASSPKSNSAYLAIEKAMAEVEKSGNLSIPLHIRNAPTQLMKDLNYGKDYQYSHDYDKHFVNQEYLPKEISGTCFYNPADNPREQEHRKYLSSCWKEKYNY
ncbi:MAG: replication-associated recombination protein A [Bacteroidales bacterium]|nr:replication-associated recombination protein A [Bacteroidales bacterium]